MSTLTWLHLSDLHAQSADKFNRDEVVLGALLADIEMRISEDGLQPNFILFTGDVAYHGKAEEYDLAVERFFEPLLATTGLSPERLFIVPGNHDVDWSEIDLVTAAGCMATLTDRDTVNDFLSLGHDRSIAFRKFKDYCDFFNRYFGNSRAFSEEHYFYVDHIEINEIKIAILGLNSAWMSGFFRGPDNRVLDHGTLLIGERQVHEAAKQAQEADIRLALMHHPLRNRNSHATRGTPKQRRRDF